MRYEFRPAARALFIGAALLTLVQSAHAQRAGALPPANRFADQVEILRTAYGIPHIRAQNLASASYAMAFVQSEDYGPSVAMGIVRARGTMGLLFGRDSIESDFAGRRRYADAVAKFHTMDRDIRDIYEGFAAGLNRFIELNPAKFPAGLKADLTPYDVFARETNASTAQAPARLLDLIEPSRRRPPPTRGGLGRAEEGAEPFTSFHDQFNDDGSNAWSFAPSRTKSGRAILMRNPHLSWTAGYYEAQLTVPGVIDFYGDFRIGGPLVGIGGFNKDLGWSTTNNDPVLAAIYSLDAAPGMQDHYLLDGAALPLKRELVTVDYKNGNATATETREFWSTPMGPVIHRANGKIYIVKSAGADDPRESLQYLRMMQAKSLEQWKDAMRMRARVTSNFTYADRAGNIMLVWNASLPSYPHSVPNDSAIFPVKRTSDMWTHYVPFDSLPQILNPKGGYTQNANDAPQFTNIQQKLDFSKHPDYFPPPILRLRSQHSILLAERNMKKKMTLEEVMELKMSYGMLLADRVKADLISAVKGTSPTGDVAAALALVEQWDNSTAPDRKGGAIFELWWRRYTDTTGFQPYAKPWNQAQLMTTPAGLSDADRAARSFVWAVDEAKRRWGRYDVAWGDVHRMKIGNVDLPGGGCVGDMGCFRVVSWRANPDGKWYATGGDGWIIGVEFTDTPKSYSVLAYGQSNQLDNPHSTDQLEMFATGKYKRVVFAPRDVEQAVIRRYKPGN